MQGFPGNVKDLGPQHQVLKRTLLPHSVKIGLNGASGRQDAKQLQKSWGDGDRKGKKEEEEEEEKGGGGGGRRRGRGRRGRRKRGRSYCGLQKGKAELVRVLIGKGDRDHSLIAGKVDDEGRKAVG